MTAAEWQDVPWVDLKDGDVVEGRGKIVKTALSEIYIEHTFEDGAWVVTKRAWNWKTRAQVAGG